MAARIPVLRGRRKGDLAVAREDRKLTRIHRTADGWSGPITLRGSLRRLTMTADERHFLTRKIEKLARLLTRARPVQMEFDSEEQFLRMLSLEPARVPVRNSRPGRRS